MKIENRIELIYLHPGAFFPETSRERVKSFDIPKTIPADCYGFYFTETEIAVSLDDKEFIGETKTVSKTYLIGETIYVNKAPVIKTHLGNRQPVTDTTVVVSPYQFTFGDPKIYKNMNKWVDTN
jgi:hypothetical protein